MKRLRDRRVRVTVTRAVRHLLLLLALAPVPGLSAQAGETGFLNRTLMLDGQRYRYQVYVPPEYDARREWPVILFLHGAGERGEDGLVQTQVGLGTAMRRFVERFPAIVVFSQARPGQVWSGATEEVALRALERTIREFRGDRRRVYLTGLSLGGYGTWRIAANHPELFAALVPICGGVVPPARVAFPAEALAEVGADSDPYGRVARRVSAIPAWVFHGVDDPLVPVEESRTMVAALRRAGGNVRYTEYPDVGHNAWDPAYAEAGLMPWLLAQRRPR